MSRHPSMSSTRPNLFVLLVPVLLVGLLGFQMLKERRAAAESSEHKDTEIRDLNRALFKAHEISEELEKVVAKVKTESKQLDSDTISLKKQLEDLKRLQNFAEEENMKCQQSVEAKKSEINQLKKNGSFLRQGVSELQQKLKVEIAKNVAFMKQINLQKRKSVARQSKVINLHDVEDDKGKQNNNTELKGLEPTSTVLEEREESTLDVDSRIRGNSSFVEDSHLDEEHEYKKGREEVKQVEKSDKFEDNHTDEEHEHKSRRKEVQQVEKSDESEESHLDQVQEVKKSQEFEESHLDEAQQVEKSDEFEENHLDEMQQVEKFDDFEDNHLDEVHQVEKSDQLDENFQDEKKMSF